MRVVSDASLYEKRAKLVNDIVGVGPNLNADVVAPLIRFGRYKVAMIAYVEKEFPHIALKYEDRDVLCFVLCKTSPQHRQPHLKEVWRMTRVTFVATSTPFLLNATLMPNFRSMKQRYPETVWLLLESMCINDLLIAQ